MYDRQSSQSFNDEEAQVGRRSGLMAALVVELLLADGPVRVLETSSSLMD